MAENDELLDELMITKRSNYNHLLYDEAIQLMKDIVNDFGNIVKLESFGKSGDGRDMMILKLDATNYFNAKGVSTKPNKKALLLTGAHHSRELVSVQMPLYTIVDLLHGLVQRDTFNKESEQILQNSQIWVIPFVNVDGFHTIWEQYMKTGELILRRKNSNRKYEHALGRHCDIANQGVDINRNYGYLWGNDNDVCSDSFAGPYPFSEKETQAMRDLIATNRDTIKFVYNFHAYGPMYIWPYNGQLKNELSITNPEAQKIFNEIWDDASDKFPATTLKGNAIQTVGYKADGEANDYIMKAFNIPSVSPELGNDNIFSSDFFIPYKFVTREVLRDNHPWILHTIRKLAGEISLSKSLSSVIAKGNGNVAVTFTLHNSGLQDQRLADQGQNLIVKTSTSSLKVPLPNMGERENIQIKLEFSAD